MGSSYSAEDLERLEESSLTLGRVLRPLGGSMLDVQLQNGTSIRVPIGGNIRIRGRGGSKTDLTNCMTLGDLIVIRGGQAAGKMSPADSAALRKIFKRLQLVTPKGFLAPPGLLPEDENEDDMFDREAEDEDDSVSIADDDVDDLFIDAI
jgi:hypothetical protein